jgi:hypothetical protein
MKILQGGQALSAHAGNLQMVGGLFDKGSLLTLRADDMKPSKSLLSFRAKPKNLLFGCTAVVINDTSSKNHQPYFTATFA